MGKFSASFPQLAAAGRGGRSWAPAQGPGKAGSLSGGPRAAGEEGHSSTKGPRAMDNPVTFCLPLEPQPWAGLGSRGPQGRLEAGAPALPHPGLPGQRDGGRGWVAGVRAGGITAYQAPDRDHPPGAQVPAGSGLAAVAVAEATGADDSPQPQGHTHNFKDPLCLSALPTLASLPLVTSLWGTSKCKMQKPGPTIQPGDLLWLVAQAALPP